MIPATSFKGKTVALFGLGGSGRATARALIEGGASVLAWDDNPDSVANAESEGVPVGDLRQADWRRFASFVNAPDTPDPSLAYTAERGQPRPATDDERADSRVLIAGTTLEVRR